MKLKTIKSPLPHLRAMEKFRPGTPLLQLFCSWSPFNYAYGARK